MHSGRAIGIAVYVGITALVITGCVAYPVLRWLLPRGRVTTVTTIASGMVFGNIPLAIAFLASLGRVGREGAAPPGSVELSAGFDPRLLFGTVIGGVSAAVFWWIAGASLRRHPCRPGAPSSLSVHDSH